MAKLVLLIIPLVIVLAACEAANDAAKFLPEQVSSSNCVVPITDVAQWSGWKVTDVRAEKDGGGGPLCNYFANTTGVMQVAIGPVKPMRCDEARKFEGSRELSGIGEWAYISDDRGKVYAKKGELCLVVNWITGPRGSQDARAGLEAIAKIAASQMP